MAKSKQRKLHQTPFAEKHATPSSSPSQHDFLTSFPRYIRIDISCVSTRPDHPHELLQFLRLTCFWTLRETISALSTLHSSNISAAFWPSLFAFSAAEAEQSASAKQHRGCFLIGLETEGEDEGIQSRRARVAGELFKRRFEALSKGHRIFKDEPVEPKIAVRSVRREELGRLVMDHAMWPQTNALVFIVRGKEIEASTRYCVAVEEEGLNPSKPIVQQKLRPASDVMNRLRWDLDLRAEDYAVVYLDRFTGYQELPVASWISDTSEEEFIPLHRIVSFRDQHTGEIVWSRERRIDKIFNS